MKFPDIPEFKRTTLKQSIFELLNSAAEEERALSNLINAEAQKTMELAGNDFPKAASNEEILQYCKSVNQIVEALLMKEWLNLRKLEAILQASETNKI